MGEPPRPGSEPAGKERERFVRWHFPVEQARCIRLADELAKSLGKPIEVVDVNRPLGRTQDVARWVTPNVRLPLFVSPSGRHIEGTDSFVPSKVRRFLSEG
jgi:hypothetical protein